jgi:hypothetical protein
MARHPWQRALLRPWVLEKAEVLLQLYGVVFGAGSQYRGVLLRLRRGAL